MTSICAPAVAETAGEAFQHRSERRGWELDPRIARAAPADAIVLFGSAEDAISDEVGSALYGMARHGHLTIPVGVVEDAGVSVDAVRVRMRHALEGRGPIDRDAVDRVMRALQPIGLDFESIGRRPLCYFGLPPARLAAVLEGMRRTGPREGRRALLDKPFGHDLRTAQALNRLLEPVFAERDVFRVDHYLPEDRVHYVLSFRRGHAFVEPLWNRRHVESVQITVADADGVGEGARYDRTGAVRDVVQSDLLYLVATIAMDLPGGSDPEQLRDERAKLLKRVRAATPCDLLRGQFRGYRQEPHVEEHSSIETFAALRLAIDSDRWSGVPFHVRTGKRLAVTATEIVIRLRHLDRAATDRSAAAGYFRFRCAPTPAIEVVTPSFSRRASDETAEYGANEPRMRASARNVLEDIITDASRGLTARFASREHIEDAWRIVNPLLHDETPVFEYAAGSWGPIPVNRSIAPIGGWVNPPHGAGIADSSLSRSEQPARC